MRGTTRVFSASHRFHRVSYKSRLFQAYIAYVRGDAVEKKILPMAFSHPRPGSGKPFREFVVPRICGSRLRDLRPDVFANLLPLAGNLAAVSPYASGCGRGRSACSISYSAQRFGNLACAFQPSAYWIGGALG